MLESLCGWALRSKVWIEGRAKEFKEWTHSVQRQGLCSFLFLEDQSKAKGKGDKEEASEIGAKFQLQYEHLTNKDCEVGRNADIFQHNAGSKEK